MGHLNADGEIESDPAWSKVVRLCYGTVVQDRAWIAHRDHVVRPIPRQLPNSGDHLLWCERLARNNFPELLLPGGEHLDVSSSDINDQYVH